MADLTDFVKNITKLSEEEILPFISEKTELGGLGSKMAIAELARRYLKEMRNSIDELKSTIKEFSSSSERYSKKIMLLTWILVFLTVFIAILTIVMVVK